MLNNMGEGALVKGTKCATMSESNICVSYNLTDYERITNQQKSIQISKSQYKSAKVKKQDLM
jgi:hypothetical protein